MFKSKDFHLTNLASKKRQNVSKGENIGCFLHQLPLQENIDLSSGLQLGWGERGGRPGCTFGRGAKQEMKKSCFYLVSELSKVAHI